MASATPLSAFQTLPFDIIELIVEAVFSGNKSRLRGIEPIKLSISHTCTLWRSVFLKRICDTLSIDLDAPFTPITFLKCPYDISPLNPHYHHMVQSVKAIEISCKHGTAIQDGSALAILKSNFPGDLVFPSIHTIVVKLGDINPYTGWEPTRDTDRNCFHYFFQHIRNLAPNVQHADVTRYRDIGFGITDNPIYDIDGAVSELFCGIKKITYVGTTKQYPTIQLNPDDISELTSIDIDLAARHGDILRAIRNSAPSLRHIRLKGLQKSYTDHLLLNDASEPVVYPLLESLILSTCTDGRDHREAGELSKFIHFPALKRFSMIPLYPFLSQMIYNCESAALETLNVLIEGQGTLFDSSYQPFTLSNFSNLKTLNFCHEQKWGAGGDNALTLIGKVARYFAAPVLNSTRSIRNVRLDGYMESDVLFRDMSTCQWIYSVNTLDIINVEIGMSDIILLLQKASRLGSLTCSLKSGALRIDGMHNDQLPYYVKTQLFPISKSFFRFKINRGKDCLVPQLAFHLLLLTIGCPNLNLIEFSSYPISKMKQIIEEITRSKPFAEHTNLYKRMELVLREFSTFRSPVFPGK